MPWSDVDCFLASGSGKPKKERSNQKSKEGEKYPWSDVDCATIFLDVIIPKRNQKNSAMNPRKREEIHGEHGLWQ
jgi:hypothetical protein